MELMNEVTNLLKKCSLKMHVHLDRTFAARHMNLFAFWNIGSGAIYVITLFFIYEARAASKDKGNKYKM